MRTIRQWWRLWRYYSRKRTSVYTDMTLATFYGITRHEVGSHQFQMVLYPRRYVLVTVVGARHLQGKLAREVQLDISGEIGMKPIRHCTFFEFVEYYGDWILNPEQNPYWATR